MEVIDDINDEMIEQQEVCNEFDEGNMTVNIPKNADKMNYRNVKVMKNIDEVNEPIIIDRVILKERPHINQLDRGV